MNTLKMVVINTILISGLAFSNLSMADKHHGAPKSYKSTQITDAVFMLQGKGGNIGLLKGKDGLLLIDADFKVMSVALKQEIAKHGGVDKLSYIINTHWHGDHTQGNYELGKYAPILAHDNVRTRLLTSQEIKLFKMVTEPYPAHAVPSITYDAHMSLHMNGEHLWVKHFSNGHTDGDSVVFFKNSNIVHTGDHFFSGFFPFVDVDHGGNVLNMAANVKQILAMIDDKTVIIPGHGPKSNKQDLQAFHDMLTGTSAEVEALMKQGMSLEQIQEKGLSSKWDAWTKGFLSTKVWISIVYNSLSKNS